MAHAPDSQLRLSDITIGDIDAKNEILKQKDKDAAVFMNGFFIPTNFNKDAFEAGEVMYVVGFKGTGKTSLLRWLGNQKVKDGNRSLFLLFKTDIKEEDRQTISRGVWFEYLPIKRAMRELDQDFKYAWSWIVIEKIFSAIANDKGVCTKSPKLEELAKILGYDTGSGHSVLLKQHLSIMPKLAAGNVEISAKSPIVEGKVGLKIVSKDKVLIPFGELVRSALSALTSLTFTGKKVFYFIDELEAFSTSQENFERDVRMIRDLLFCVNDLNSAFRNAGVPIYVIAAVRSEVLAVVNRAGQEIGRAVDDFSFHIDWSQGARNPQHPLIQLIRRKIRASEIERYGRQKNMDPVATYLPNEVDGTPIAIYLLDGTMYRPRDLVRRLGIVKKRSPSSLKFDDDTLKSTFGTYSEQMWQEVSEELVPGYAPDQVVDLEHALRGFSRYFYKREFAAILHAAAVRRPALKKLLLEHNPDLILQDFFRLGVVGNFYKDGDGNTSRQVARWAFRGATHLDVERRMAFHRALWPHLLLVNSRPSARPPR